MSSNFIERLERIEAKLDAVIAALHEYDGNDKYGESSFEAFMDDEKADENAATFNDYGMRVVDKDKDNNTQDNKRVGGKKRNNELPDFKHTPPPPKPKRRYYKPKQTK